MPLKLQRAELGYCPPNFPFRLWLSPRDDHVFVMNVADDEPLKFPGFKRIEFNSWAYLDSRDGSWVKILNAKKCGGCNTWCALRIYTTELYCEPTCGQEDREYLAALEAEELRMKSQ